MQPAPAPSAAETRANQTFEALLWALSRPGQLRTLPDAGEAALVACLLDRECHAYCADPVLMPKVLETGAFLADLPQADHVFLGDLTGLEPLGALRRGSDLYPDDGATVVIRAQLGQGPALRLTGPGIETTQTVQIGGLPDGFWARRRALIRYPMGFDLFFLDGAQVMGLPRSTSAEVL